MDSDTMFFRALVKCIEIVGEAAARVSTETRNKYPQVPWTQINGMRNRLIHAYSDVDKELVWATVEKALPLLDEDLRIILSEPRERG